MTVKMVIDTYESAAKARPRAHLLNKAFAGVPEKEMVVFSAMKASNGFSVWAEYDREAYPCFDDVDSMVRSKSIEYRKAQRKASKGAK